MKLNDKYEKLTDKLAAIVDNTPAELELYSVVGLILRHVIELHQKMDEVLEKLEDVKLSEELWE